ncbi:MAG: immune inhibitor A [Candidatus Zixiibacteriota bacterium]|nr:MAG: immune inhibitor A [candidate division Zixibacteria bacterium]
MKRLIILLILVSVIFTSFLYAATRERPMLVRVDFQNNKALDFLAAGHFDIAFVSKGEFAEIVADDVDYDRLVSAGLKVEIVHDDLVGFYQSRIPLGATMGGFPTLDEAIAFMDSLQLEYPNLMTARDSVGYSIEGRPLWMVKISDNPDIDEDEPEFFINALIHAREPIGLEVSLRYMSYLCGNYSVDPLVTDLVDNREIYFVPVVNPDGYEYNRITSPNGGGMHRKNMNPSGNVDLNRNWGYQWGYDNIGSSPDPEYETYRGAAAFSEPETNSLRQFIISREFSIILNLHSYGDYFLYSWGYDNVYTPDNLLLSTIGDSATAVNNYEYGTAWEILYYVNGDANDWQYGEQIEKPKILGFVAEIGTWQDGFWPDPNRIPVLWSEIFPTLLYLTEVSANPYASAPPLPPVLNPIGEVLTDSFTVSWSHDDTLNPAVAYELKELSGMDRVEDGFEDGTSNWILNGFQRSAARAHTGSYSLFSGLYNGYNGSAMLENGVSIAGDDTLFVWLWYSIEPNYDYGYVSLSTDGGNTFVNLEGNVTTDDNPHGLNQGNGITGTSNAWVLGIFPLDDYTGQFAQLAVRYVTDGSLAYPGLYADDFYPVETFENEVILGSDIIQTEFLVTGRQNGEYYYLARAKDAEDQWSGYSNREAAIVNAPTSIDDPIIPMSLALDQNYPNPFNPQTSILYTIPEKSFVELSIYNILGMKVRTLIDSEIGAGEYTVIFNGRDDSGSPVSAGIYFYRLKTDTGSLTRKMVLIK